MRVAVSEVVVVAAALVVAVAAVLLLLATSVALAAVSVQLMPAASGVAPAVVVTAVASVVHQLPAATAEEEATAAVTATHLDHLAQVQTPPGGRFTLHLPHPSILLGAVSAVHCFWLRSVLGVFRLTSGLRLFTDRRSGIISITCSYPHQHDR